MLLAGIVMTNSYYRREARRALKPYDEWQQHGTEPDVDAILCNAPTQLRLWHYVDDYKRQRNGNPPTRQQIADHLCCSKQRVDRIIEMLEEKQVIILDELLRPMIYWKEY